MNAKPKTVDEYLGSVDAERRAELERIRALVMRLVPEVEETMSYGMPTLKYRGRALVHFTASKNHMSLFPSSWAIDASQEIASPTTRPPSTRSALPWSSPSRTN